MQPLHPPLDSTIVPAVSPPHPHAAAMFPTSREATKGDALAERGRHRYVAIPHRLVLRLSVLYGRA